MKKLLLGAILLSIIISCSDKKKKENRIETPIFEKTAIELEDESMKKGGSSDTTSYLHFVLGMTKTQVIKHCKELKEKNIIGYYTNGKIYCPLETDNFKTNVSFDFFYDNEDKLFRIVEQIPQEPKEKTHKSNLKANYKEEILSYFRGDLEKKPLTNGTQSKAKFYWLNGDKRFDYIETEEYFALATSKISAERKMMSYYEELDRKKLEEEYLAKEKNENQQRHEEETIIEKLKAKAKRNWPEDYTTQEYWINEQIEAYHYMLSISNNDKIKKKAQRDWPLDFTTQQFWYNQQIEARQRLEK